MAIRTTPIVALCLLSSLASAQEGAPPTATAEPEDAAVQDEAPAPDEEAAPDEENLSGEGAAPGDASTDRVGSENGPAGRAEAASAETDDAGVPPVPPTGEARPPDNAVGDPAEAEAAPPPPPMEGAPPPDPRDELPADEDDDLQQEDSAGSDGRRDRRDQELAPDDMVGVPMSVGRIAFGAIGIFMMIRLVPLAAAPVSYWFAPWSGTMLATGFTGEVIPYGLLHQFLTTLSLYAMDIAAALIIGAIVVALALGLGFVLGSASIGVAVWAALLLLLIPLFGTPILGSVILDFLASRDAPRMIEQTVHPKRRKRRRRRRRSETLTLPSLTSQAAVSMPF